MCSRTSRRSSRRHGSPAGWRWLARRHRVGTGNGSAGRHDSAASERGLARCWRGSRRAGGDAASRRWNAWRRLAWWQHRPGGAPARTRERGLARPDHRPDAGARPRYGSAAARIRYGARWLARSDGR